MSARVGHTAFMKRAPGSRYQAEPSGGVVTDEWRLTTPWRDKSWMTRAWLDRWLGTGRQPPPHPVERWRENVHLLQTGLGIAGYGLVWVLAAAVRAPAGAVAAGAYAVLGLGVAVLGGAVVRSAVRELRPPVDRVRLDHRDLWWVRRCPGWPDIDPTGPTRVARSDIVEVRLDPEDSVVVCTVDGLDHFVTDLGTTAERVALATAIGDAVGPGIARVQPGLPPELPHRWRAQRGGDDTTTVWRRPVRGLRWVALALAVPAFVALLAAALLVFFYLTPLVFVPAMALYLLCQGVAWMFHPTGTGWLVGSGRVEAVRVETDDGWETGSGGSRRVVALELRRRTAYARLDAVFDDADRRKIMSGTNAVTGFARWLSDRADVPLEEVHAWRSGGSGSRAKAAAARASTS